jgi:hypothetical protein
MIIIRLACRRSFLHRPRLGEPRKETRLRAMDAGSCRRSAGTKRARAVADRLRRLVVVSAADGDQLIGRPPPGNRPCRKRPEGTIPEQVAPPVRRRMGNRRISRWAELDDRSGPMPDDRSHRQCSSKRMSRATESSLILMDPWDAMGKDSPAYEKRRGRPLEMSRMGYPCPIFDMVVTDRPPASQVRK